MTGTQLIPVVDYHNSDGSWTDFQRLDTDQIRYRYDGVPTDKTIIAVQVRNGLEWSHEYAPGTLVNPIAPNLTMAFKPEDKPNIWFFFIQ